MERDISQEISQFISENPVALFMKGVKEQPECGFSKTVVEILNLFTNDFACKNVLTDPEIREGVKAFSKWPTIPQLYINNNFIGGCDIIKDLYASGELIKLLKIEPAKTAPNINLTNSAKNSFLKALEREDKDTFIRITVPANFSYELSFDEKSPNDFVINSEGVNLLIDNISALRANGLTIDFHEEGLNRGFIFNNPKEPPKVKELLVEELDQWQKSSKEYLLIDVRPEKEREIAKISFDKRLCDISKEQLENLAKDLPIVFYCRSGGRSRLEGEKWRLLGFTNVYNLTGGVNAWARDIDSSISTY